MSRTEKKHVDRFDIDRDWNAVVTEAGMHQRVPFDLAMQSKTHRVSLTVFLCQEMRSEITRCTIQRVNGHFMGMRELRAVLRAVFDGQDREAVYLFPADDRDPVPDDMYVAWVLPEGRRWPFGTGWVRGEQKGPALARLALVDPDALTRVLDETGQTTPAAQDAAQEADQDAKGVVGASKE